MLGFSTKPYRLGIVLSGGGARGFAHCGALQAFEEVGLRPEIMAGVSAGSVVTAMYAAGLTPLDILNVFADAKFGDFAEFGVPRQGFFSMEGFRKMLRRVIPYTNLQDLPLPAVVCATNLDTYQPAAFWEGDIADCVSASCSIPIVFNPVRIDGTMYVDGGVTANLPAWVLRDKCKYLLGVNCSPVPHRHAPRSIIDIAQRTYDLLVKTNSVKQMEMCDLAVQVDDVANYQVFNLKEIDRVYQLGYDETMRALLNAGFVHP